MCYLDVTNPKPCSSILLYIEKSSMSGISSMNSSPAAINADALTNSRTRSVRFSELAHVIPTTAYDEDVNILSRWYQAEDLQVFRTEARELCRHMRQHVASELMSNTLNDNGSSSSATTSSSTSMSTFSLDKPLPDQEDLSLTPENATSRGLELRSCLERQRRKYMANKYILKASQTLLCATKLAKLCSKCTSWAKKLALEEGKRDYERVYETETMERESIEHNITEQPTIAPFTTPLPVALRPVLKRAVSDETESERHVRPRLAAAIVVQVE
ncbi:hypothetical protein MPSEU_000870100 [Mayamaea pseudoterrestris]|nr:hypothetical protein MPSEU_000870100 [Mayamaea pseudoterrestris]